MSSSAGLNCAQSTFCLISDSCAAQVEVIMADEVWQGEAADGRGEVGVIMAILILLLLLLAVVVVN